MAGRSRRPCSPRRAGERTARSAVVPWDDRPWRRPRALPRRTSRPGGAVAALSKYRTGRAISSAHDWTPDASARRGPASPRPRRRASCSHRSRRGGGGCSSGSVCPSRRPPSTPPRTSTPRSPPIPRRSPRRSPPRRPWRRAPEGLGRRRARAVLRHDRRARRRGARQAARRPGRVADAARAVRTHPPGRDRCRALVPGRGRAAHVRGDDRRHHEAADRLPDRGVDGAWASSWAAPARTTSRRRSPR